MLNPRSELREITDATLVELTCEYILSCQRDDGGIAWFTRGKLDPWDHTEAIMGLTIGGHYQAARHGFAWLQANQNADGSWYAKYYGDGADDEPERYKIETNFVAYPACGLWHYFLVSGDSEGSRRYFPIVKKAIEFVLSHQHVEGDIQWALSERESLPHDALITACASILRSLECAILLAAKLDRVPSHWIVGYHRLADALKNKPWRFDRTWESKARFSMDWFYPILAGLYTKVEAQQRLRARWQEFVHPDYGCRCVSDEPWVTVAESCELTLALAASGKKSEARRLFRQLLRWQDKDGGFWTGYSFRDQAIWPLEKTTWTAAAILLALDALEALTPAHTVLIRPSHLLFPQDAQ